MDNEIMDKIERLAFNAGLYQGALLGAGKKQETKLDHILIKKLRRILVVNSENPDETVIVYGVNSPENILLGDLRDFFTEWNKANA